MSTESLLVAQEEYLKSGIHIGTKFKTKYMADFIYKTRSDGLSVLNLQKIDERIRVVASLLSHYNPQDILLASRRENSWKAIKVFAKATGVRAYAGRYPPGILTNPELKSFVEAKIVFVIDPWLDKNPIKDAILVHLPIISLCDTNNVASNIDLVVPCNNKSNKTIGLALWVIAREYNKARNISNELPSLEEFQKEK